MEETRDIKQLLGSTSDKRKPKKAHKSEKPGLTLSPQRQISTAEQIMNDSPFHLAIDCETNQP
jgi:hypothetical protein